MPDINHTFMNLREQILSCRQCQSDLVLNPILLSSAIPALKLCRSARRLPGRSIIQESLSMIPAAEGSAPNGTESPMKFFIIRTTFTLYPSPTVIPVKSKGGDNRPPKCCADKWLSQELRLVQNEIYILIGSSAASYFFPKQKLTDLVFQDLTLNGKKKPLSSLTLRHSI